MKNGYQHIVIDDFVERLREIRKVREEEMGKLRSKADALAFQAKVRAIVAKAFEPWPEKCPLEAETTGTQKCDGYTLEKVRFNSRPGYWVTGNLYIPDGLTAPAPASLAACGHASEGKASTTYQSFCIRLVRNGFVVLMYDPVEQGERKQYEDLEYLGQARGLCAAHNVMGKQLELLGESMPSWRVWDGRRALDYLLTRPEVDPKRIGITGNSGGGTLSEWIWSNEDRLAFAAPSCHVTTFLGNLENELPTDAEQCPAGVIGGGLEMVDLMICQAPKPVKLLGQKYDFFERRGLVQAYRDLKHFYSLLDAEDKVELYIGPTTHGYSDHNQREMVKFFCKCAGKQGEPFEFQPAPLSEQETYVYPEGSVVKAGSRHIYELMQDMAKKDASTRVAPVQGEWQAVLNKLLALPAKPIEPPHFRCLRATTCADIPWARYAVETERNIRTIIRKRGITGGCFQTLDVEDEIDVYIPNFSSELDATSDCCMKDINPGGLLYALDVRGLGESMQDDEGDIHQPYGMDFMMHSFSMMFGESYFGRRVYDVLRTLDLLVAEGAKVIRLHGRGQGALIAAYVAMLDARVQKVTLYDAPKSYNEWIDAKVCDWPAANVPRGVLKYFDLPDLYAALGDRLVVASNWNAYMK